MNDIGGNVCIRDGAETDYPWRECVKSLLPICDSVTICDGGSTDGTLQSIVEWQKSETKIRLVHFPWPNPKGEGHFWVTWLNWCREQIPHFWHLQLDADEILFESSYEWIEGFTRTKREESAKMLRLNFWKNAQHLIPRGHACGFEVIRLAPQALWLPSDYPHPLGRRVCDIAVPSPVRIAHYGFLRKREAYFLKLKRYQAWVDNSYDPRLVVAEASDNYIDNIAASSGWAHLVEPYNGSHPALAWDWLKERGYKLL